MTRMLSFDEAEFVSVSTRERARIDELQAKLTDALDELQETQDAVEVQKKEVRDYKEWVGRLIDELDARYGDGRVGQGRPPAWLPPLPPLPPPG